MNIYDYEDYQIYLTEHLKSLPNSGHGIKSAIAEKIGCQTTYVSRVLNRKTHFSLEQVEKLTEFLGLVENEAHYFFLLVQKDRAGTEKLKQYFLKQIKKERQKQLLFENRLGVKKTLTREDQAIYYSSWHYSVVHVMLSIPEFKTKSNLANALKLSMHKISKILEFLVSVKLVTENQGKYECGSTRIHLENDSPMISKHHINWRMQAMQSIERGNASNIHYSSVVTLSKEDAYKIKETLIKMITKNKNVIRESKEEVVFGYSIDFFDVLGVDQ